MPLFYVPGFGTLDEEYEEFLRGGESAPDEGSEESPDEEGSEVEDGESEGEGEDENVYQDFQPGSAGSAGGGGGGGAYPSPAAAPAPVVPLPPGTPTAVQEAANAIQQGVATTVAVKNAAQILIRAGKPAAAAKLADKFKAMSARAKAGSPVRPAPAARGGGAPAGKGGAAAKGGGTGKPAGKLPAAPPVQRRISAPPPKKVVCPKGKRLVGNRCV